MFSRFPGSVLAVVLALFASGVLHSAPPGRFDADALRSVPDSVRPFVEDGSLAGAVTLVARADQVAQVSAVGFSDLEARRPMRTDDLFWIASMTKPMTAVALMMLADEGRLSVEDPVERHLPEFRGQWMISEQATDRRVVVPAPRPITLHDLLTHTSGIGDFPAPRAESSLAELVTGYAREPLRFPPGDRWAYSNAGINTLGRVVEVVSGIPFAQFLQQRIFDPLGMRDTTFWPDAAQEARLARSYEVGGTPPALTETGIYFIGGNLSDRHRTAFPAGGLFSTASDVARFHQMMLRGGEWNGHRLLAEASVARMTRTQTGSIRTGFVDGMSWGLGFQVVKEPLGVTSVLSPGSFGHGGAYGTQAWADPARDLILILMIQRRGLPNADASPMRQAFQAAAAAALKE